MLLKRQCASRKFCPLLITWPQFSTIPLSFSFLNWSAILRKFTIHVNILEAEIATTELHMQYRVDSHLFSWVFSSAFGLRTTLLRWETTISCLFWYTNHKQIPTAVNLNRIMSLGELSLMWWSTVNIMESTHSFLVLPPLMSTLN